MNTGELQDVFCSGSDAQMAGKPITWNPYPKNGSGAWLVWQAGWLAAEKKQSHPKRMKEMPKMERLSRMNDIKNKSAYIFDATSNTCSPDDVSVQIELNFATACQVMKAIAAQSWSAAVQDMMPHNDFCDKTSPMPMVFSVIGKLKEVDDRKESDGMENQITRQGARPAQELKESMIFSFDDFAVGVVVDTTGTVWFKAEDICWLSGFRSKPRKILDRDVDREDIEWFEVTDVRDRTRVKAHVNVHGMSVLTSLSKDPRAKRLQEWILSRLLPSISKMGKLG